MPVGKLPADCKSFCCCPDLLHGPFAGVIETILGSKTLDKLVKYTSAAASKASKAVPQSAKSAVARDARMTNGWLQQHTPKVLYQAGKGVVSGTTKATKSATRAVRAEMGKQQTRRIVREMAQRGLVPADAASFVGRHTNREEFLAALRTNSPYRGYVSSEARGMHGVAYGYPQRSQPRHHDQYDTHGQPPTYSASASPEYYHAAAATGPTPPQNLASQPLLRSWSRGHDYPHPSSSLFTSSPAPSPYTTAPGHQPPPHDIGGGWRPAPAPPGHRRFASPPPGPSVRQKGKGVVID